MHWANEGPEMQNIPCPYFEKLSLCFPNFQNLLSTRILLNVRVDNWGGVVVKALRYYSDGPGIDSRWCHWIFQ